MPHRSSLRFPSYRNLFIYHELTVKRRSQAAMAAEIGISQRAVSGIGMQVRAWVDSTVKPRHYIGQPGMRFHLAIAHERLRLKDAYEPLVGMFTGDDENPRYLRRYVTVVGGEALNTIEVSDRPDFRLLNQALGVQVRLAELEAVANRGPFADLPTQIHQTIIHSAVPAHHRAPAVPPPPTASSNRSTTRSNPPQNQASEVLT